jgi:hypothetical protein
VLEYELDKFFFSSRSVTNPVFDSDRAQHWARTREFLAGRNASAKYEEVFAQHNMVSATEVGQSEYNLGLALIGNKEVRASYLRQHADAGDNPGEAFLDKSSALGFAPAAWSKFDRHYAAFLATSDQEQHERAITQCRLAAKMGHPNALAFLRHLGFSAEQSSVQEARPSVTWDVFVSHASEDKDSVARPLVWALRQAGVSVWFDEAELTVGDSLYRSIENGLANSRYGIVIISNAFLSKHWPQRELNGLATREVFGKKVILPIWHGVQHADVAARSPMLADRIAASCRIESARRPSPTSIMTTVQTSLGGVPARPDPSLERAFPAVARSAQTFAATTWTSSKTMLTIA